MIDLLSICKDVVRLSKNCAEFIRKESLSFSKDKIEYKGLNDLVSYVDKHTENLLVEGLSKILPGSGFITEEETENTNREYQWIIDPLDGTTNFIHGLPVYAISIALQKNNEIILGVVYEPNRDECFYAYKNGGAYLNDHRIRVAANEHLSEALLATGFPYTFFEGQDQYLHILKELMQATHGLRRMGSAAVDMAYVACGRFDAFFEYNLNAWDIAAGSLLVQEAGGLVTDFDGGNNYLFGRTIIAGNTVVHKELQRVIGRHWK